MDDYGSRGVQSQNVDRQTREIVVLGIRGERFIGRKRLDDSRALRVRC